MMRSIAELKGKLRGIGLPVGGNKAALEARLAEYVRGAPLAWQQAAALPNKSANNDAETVCPR